MKRTIVLIPAIAVLLAGCGSCSSGGFGGVYDLPLPGGADLGSHPYTVTAQFTDVLDLVPQSAVKVNDVAVGRVESITLPPQRLDRERHDAHQRRRAPARERDRAHRAVQPARREVHRAAAPPGDGAQGTLADNATIPLARTNRNPEVEEVFGALSLLLNGGGIDQLQTITPSSTAR